MAAVSTNLTDLHLFASAGGAVYEAVAGDADAGFSAWSAVAALADAGAVPSFLPSSAPTAVSRTADVLDVFALASDHHLYTASRTFNPVDTGWQPWAQVGSDVFPDGTSASVVSRIPVQYDLYTLDVNDDPRWLVHNYSVPSPSWSDGGWAGWYSLDGMTAAPGAELVARSGEQNVHLFVIDDHDAVVTRSFTGSTNDFDPAWVPLSACSAVLGATSLEVVEGVGGAMEVIAVDGRGVVYVADRKASP